MQSRAAVVPGQTVTVTVVNGARSIDLALPVDVALIEILPLIARRLGMLDPTLAHGGYSLVRADGSALPPASTLGAQRLSDGELLKLVVGALQPEAIVYDDIVEAVGDAVQRLQRQWTADDSANTALVASTGFLVIAAALLAALGAQPVIAAISLAAAVISLTISAVLARQRQAVAALTIALTSTLFAAISGLQFTSASIAAPGGGSGSWLSAYGWPLVGAGVGAAVFGAAAFALLPSSHRVYALIPVTAGILVAVAAGVNALVAPEQPSVVWGLVLAIAATAGNGVPWVALSGSRIVVESPHTEQEIFAVPADIDEQQVRERYRRGAALVLVLRVAIAVLLFVSVPAVASASSFLGALLCVFAFVGAMLTTRLSFARSEVLTVIATGIAGLVLTGLVTAGAHPEWNAVVAAILGGSAIVVVMLTLLESRQTVRMGRIADGVALITLAGLLPLGVALAGLF